VLKLVLGEDARQAGSLVAPDRLRFDFTWPRALTPEERERVEAEVNRRIREDHPLVTRVFDPAAAKATGAVSMFGEKYGDRIRVLTAGDSMEYCGGTHCRRTGDIEEFRIATERSIGSGVRRIEAVTGREAVRALEEERRRAEAASEVERQKREAAKAAKRMAGQYADQGVDILLGKRNKGKSVEYMAVEVKSSASLLPQADRVKGQVGVALAVLLYVSTKDGVDLVAVGNQAAVKAGFNAGSTVSDIAKLLGGGGGGRPDLARGKGKDAARLPEAVKAFEGYLAGL
jgi:alanyl-tRNA synthetase